MMGAGKGVIRTMWCNGQYNADLVPVDVICNGLITVAWKIATESERYEHEHSRNIRRMVELY